MASYAIAETEGIPASSVLAQTVDNLVALNNGGGTVLPATTGVMTATMDGAIKRITPTGDCTFNATGGRLGQECSFVVTTTGTSARTLTFGTNFKSTGTLSTGTVDAKTFSVSFIYDGTNWVETARTTAM